MSPTYRDRNPKRKPCLTTRRTTLLDCQEMNNARRKTDDNSVVKDIRRFISAKKRLDIIVNVHLLYAK